MEYRVAVAQQLSGLLRSFRKERKMTQQQLGERLGMTQRMVAKFESCPERAKFERVLQALSALEIDLILKERETPAPTSNRDDFPKNSEAGTW